MPLRTVPARPEHTWAMRDPEQALPCHLVDPDLFFTQSPADVERAKAVCLACSARRACLVGALDRHEPWGVWGGELVINGVVVPHKRSRGRPRKKAIAGLGLSSALVLK